jgi:hypothetical protein
LKKNSGELFDKAEQFRDVCPGIQLCSFYETLPVSGAGMVIASISFTNLSADSTFSVKIIVDRNSAFIGVNGEEFTPLHADHRNVCKFESPDDQNLALVRSSIRKIMKKVTSFGGTLTNHETIGL